MTRIKKNTIEVQGTEIAVLSLGEDDFISLTDMAQNFDPPTLHDWPLHRTELSARARQWDLTTA